MRAEETKKFSFPHRCIPIWNGFNQEMVCAEYTWFYFSKPPNTHTHTPCSQPQYRGKDSNSSTPASLVDIYDRQGNTVAEFLLSYLIGIMQMFNGLFEIILTINWKGVPCI